jgi:CHASE2 domain-containing sensor protein
MKLDYFRRASRSTTVEQTDASPSVWRALGLYLKRFWKDAFWKALPVLLLLTLVIFICEKLGWFEGVQAASEDAYARALARQDALGHGAPLDVPKEILIVEITDEDYKTLFGARSPLNPNSVLTLIDSVRQLHPTVIGVDLDTRDAQWACATHVGDYLGPDSRVIWAQVPSDPPSGGQESAGPDEAEPVALGPVLGGLMTDPSRMGVVRFPIDTDGFVRSFRTTYPVRGDSPLPTYADAKAVKCDPKGIQQHPELNSHVDVPGPMPSFFDAVARRADPQLPPPDAEKKYLKFTGGRYNFQIVQASEFIHVPAPKNSEAKKKTEAAVTDVVPTVEKTPIRADRAAKLQRRTILIGGSYGQARDEYMTALGKMEGVELLANGVETEMSKGITSVGTIGLILFDLFFGTVIVWIYFQFGKWPVWALILSLTAMAGVVVVGAFYYYAFGAFLSFVPVMTGMLIHQMYEGTKESVQLKHEVKAQSEEIKKLKGELAEFKQPPLEPGVIVPSPASALPGAVGTARGVKTTVVETESEHVHMESVEKTPTHKRGHAAGKP